MIEWETLESNNSLQKACAKERYFEGTLVEFLPIVGQLE